MNALVAQQVEQSVLTMDSARVSMQVRILLGRHRDSSILSRSPRTGVKGCGSIPWKVSDETNGAGRRAR